MKRKAPRQYFNACNTGKPIFVEEHLSQGSIQGRTALDFAISNRSTKMVDLLSSLGAKSGKREA